MKKGIYILILVFCKAGYGQLTSPNFHVKTFEVLNDTVQIDSISISPLNFKVFTLENIEVDTLHYKVDFTKAQLIFNKNYSNNFKSVKIQYTTYPSFLTQKYFKLNPNLIIPSATNTGTLYSLTTNKNKQQFRPFDGLNTAGIFTRGLTVGNNQNAVINSTLDLQLEGKISSKVTLRGSIIDTNLPVQENGNTYELDEFDRVFIEMFSDNWSINAGDIYFNNTDTRYLKIYNKKVSGMAVDVNFKNKKGQFNIHTSGAVVEGKYKKVNFVGTEGNQGPYKLSDYNDETYILILEGTEKIYVNGVLLKRGENNDYIIDYSNAEVTFNSTYPITADMRISAEYQFSERVYTRFTTYNKVRYSTDKLQVSGYFFNESDLKNQPLNQDLTQEQQQILVNAGNDLNAMNSPSAVPEIFSEDKILYKKINNGILEFFEYANTNQEDLYNVTFTYVGENMGDYVLKDVIAIGKIYEFAGENMGNYNPIVQLTAPKKLQIAVFKAAYSPTEKTQVYAETAISNNDENLFSKINNSENDGLATKFGLNQIVFDKTWKLSTEVNYEKISKNYRSVERIQNIEFDRDWNIASVFGEQQLFSSIIRLQKESADFINYSFENLRFNNDYSGNRHQFFGAISKNRVLVNFNGSFLNNTSLIEEGQFMRYYVNANYNFSKSWIGTLLSGEKNEQKNLNSNTLLPKSHQYKLFETFFGVGDSTKVFAKIGANFRITDSILNNKLSRVNNSKIYYLKTNLIQGKNSQLNAYVNYRAVDNVNFKDEKSLNSKINYNQQLFKQLITLNTVYQTISGTLPQQDYSYLKTEPGQGFYTWIDYNKNGEKELDEFEIAQFSDQASYLRIILPTINYIATNQNSYTQNLIINPQRWVSKKGVQKFLSRFYNQTFLFVNSKQKKEAKKFNLNPFVKNGTNVLELNYNFNNTLYFNKGKQFLSVSYNYLQSRNKSTTTIDDLDNYLLKHRLFIEHKFGDFWLLNIEASNSKNETTSTNFLNRNYKLKNYALAPKLYYKYSKQMYFSVFYELKQKKNTIENFELLRLNKIGTELSLSSNDKFLMKADFKAFTNTFTGVSNSPTAYEMLEGFQPGKNYTWSTLLQKKINSFLYVNLNYLGRKSEQSIAIHTGTVQLKALF